MTDTPQIDAGKIARSINTLAYEVHANAKNKGFYDGCDLDKVIGLRPAHISNLHSEVSELWEADRNNKLLEACDKADKMAALGLPPMTNAEEELADIIIRALDTAEAIGIDIGNAVVNKHLFNQSRPHRHGGKKH